MAKSNDNRCVCCGVTIPEGRQVCPGCIETVSLKLEKDNIINRQKAKLKEANHLICELCEKCGENICKDGEECDWKEGVE